jgi:hypothetical protein
MKKTIVKQIYFISCILPLVVVPLAAKDGVYIEGAVGSSFNDTFTSQRVKYVYERCAFYTAYIGYKYQNWRIDMEYKHASENLYSASIDNSFSVGVDGRYNKDIKMLNFYYDAYNHTKLLSSFGFGVGVQDKEIEEKYRDTSIITLQAIVGAGYQITPSLITNVRFSFTYAQESSHFDTLVENDLSLSLRYIF